MSDACRACGHVDCSPTYCKCPCYPESPGRGGGKSVSAGDRVASMLSVGTIVREVMPFTAWPEGWLALDGTVHAKATYPELYAALKQTGAVLQETETMFAVPYYPGSWIKARP